MITAIQTSYAGYRFRSRLEARWAVFFDTLGIKWEYEVEGYEIRRGESKSFWLPDFVLRKFAWWEDGNREDVLVEVKGTEEDFLSNRQTYGNAIDYGGQVPGGGLLVLGSIPNPEQRIPGWGPVHAFLRWDSGVLRDWLWFDSSGQPRLLPNDYGHEVATEDIPDAGDLPYLGPNFARYPGFGAWDAYRAARSARFEHGENGR